MASIKDKAMLVNPHICMWTARKHDRKISDEVAAQHNAQHDAGRYNKLLIAKAALAEITRAAGAARAFHVENTVPWADDGARMLPAENYFAYTTTMRELRGSFEAAVAKFCDGYPQYVADARVRLNGMFDEKDYPTAAQINARFAFDVVISPLPDASDFRVSLGEAEETRIRSEIEDRVNAALDGAVRDLWQRVHDCVAHIAERLRAYKVERDPDTGKDKVSNPFRDSLVTNLRDLVDLLPRLNLTGDPSLAAMRDKLAAQLAPHEPQALRDSEALREQVARTAEDILRDMAGYCAAA
jgi:hypothetical protein